MEGALTRDSLTRENAPNDTMEVINYVMALLWKMQVAYKTTRTRNESRRGII